MQSELFKPKKKVILFVDGSNLFHSLWECYKTHILDIQELASKLCNLNRELKQIRYYYSPFIMGINPRMYRIQQKYIEKIKNYANVYISEGKYVRKPILLKKETMNKIKPYITRDELWTYIEKGVDVKIAVDMIALGIANAYDTAILVSGDGDFVPVINKLKELKKIVQVAMIMNDNRKSYDLKEHAKSIINLEHIIPGILKKQKSRREGDPF